MTKIIVTTLIGLLALAFAIAQVSGKSVQAAGVTGTAASVHSHGGATALVLRVGGHHLVDLTVSAHTATRSSDGSSISAANILLGDRLTVSASGSITDLSQRVATIKGIVSVAPLSRGDPLIVQLASAAVLIDLSTKTRYHDASHETARMEQLEDADEIQVRGLLDTARGEMPRADSVVRLGPVHKGARG